MRIRASHWAAGLVSWAAVALAGAAVSATIEASVRTLVLEGPVVALAAATNSDGNVLQVAFVMRAGGCDSVSVWQLDVRRQRKLSPRWCDRRVYGLSLSERAASWATYRQLANGRRVQEIWRVEVSPSRDYGRARRLVRAVVDSGRSLPIVVGNDSYVRGGRVYAGGQLVPSARIPPLTSVPRWVSFEEFTVVVGYRDGRVETYLTSKAPNDPIPYSTARFEPASELRLVRIVNIFGIAIAVGPRLVLRNHTLRDGSEMQLPAAASYGDDRCFRPTCPPVELRFADEGGPFVAYLLGRQVRVRNLITGSDAVIRAPRATPVHAQIRPTGLIYSAGNTITYVPRAHVTRLLDR